MKRISLICYDMSSYGGVEKVSVALSAALADFYEVHLLSLCRTSELNYDLDPRVSFSSFDISQDRLRYMHTKLRPLLKEYFKEHQIDVAIIQGHYSGFCVSQMRFLGKTHYHASRYFSFFMP